MNTSSNKELEPVIATANSYAQRRMISIGKGNTRFKISSKDLKDELVFASVYGELSCLERILGVIQNNPDMTREDIEAEIHLSVVDYNNLIKENLGYGLKITLDSYLELRGYT